MNAELALDMSDIETVRKAVSPSLRDSGKVRFDVGAGEALAIAVEADTLGALRGGVNTALMLSRLSDKFIGREVNAS